MNPTTMNVLGTAIVVLGIVAMVASGAPAWAVYEVLAFIGSTLVLSAAIFATRR